MTEETPRQKGSGQGPQDEGGKAAREQANGNLEILIRLLGETSDRMLRAQPTGYPKKEVQRTKYSVKEPRGSLTKQKCHGKAGNILQALSQKNRTEKRLWKETRPAPALFPAVLGRRLVWLQLPSCLFGCFAGQGVGGSGGFETNRRANRPLSGSYEQCGLKVQGHGGLHVEPRRRPAEGPKRWQRNPRRRKGSRSAPGRSAGSELWVQRGDHERSERARGTQRRVTPDGRGRDRHRTFRMSHCMLDDGGTGPSRWTCHTLPERRNDGAAEHVNRRGGASQDRTPLHLRQRPGGPPEPRARPPGGRRNGSPTCQTA